MSYGKIEPSYLIPHNWELYSEAAMIEYQQSIDEGLDIARYKEVFVTTSRLLRGEIKSRMADIVFDIVRNAETVEGYKYNEPSDLEGIKKLRKAENVPTVYDKATYESRLYGAWMGRVCGCMLGKSIEGIRTNELIPFLKESGNYPMHRYVLRSDVTPETIQKYKFHFASSVYIDELDGMPPDDDTNYLLIAQELIEKHGRDFTPTDVAKVWMRTQSKEAYCTAERVAFCNFINGYYPPQSAIYKNPYREWIGAQIRGDYFGYVNPADPEAAAEMAWRDGGISHVKNGIYGEMWISAMLAVAATGCDVKTAILGGLAEIPATSRLHEAICSVIDGYENGVSKEKCFADIHEKFDEYTGHGWCHTISNAMVVTASLLYGEGDYARSICMAVETGFDTDCNGATVGSVLGMLGGIDAIPSYWKDPINDTLYTNLIGMHRVNITECARKTLAHLK